MLKIPLLFDLSSIDGIYSKYLYYLLIYVIFSKNLVAIVFLIAVAKVRTFILIFQIFSEVFLFFLQLSEFRLDLPTSPISDRITFLNLSIMLTTASLSIAGAKVERIFETAKYF